MFPMGMPQGGGLNQFSNQGLQLNNQAAGQSAGIMGSMMGDIQGTSAMQMKMQTEMAQISMMMKLNEALAKIFKAIGDAVKNLAG
jgi:hypothetical protein